jgi:hypothetical protein
VGKVVPIPDAFRASGGFAMCNIVAKRGGCEFRTWNESEQIRSIDRVLNQGCRRNERPSTAADGEA